MSLGEWVDVAVKLLTSGVFVGLVLGIVAICMFRASIRERIAVLQKVDVMGLLAEFESRTAALTKDALGIVTRENQAAIQELMTEASSAGHTLALAGMQDLPEWQITWEGEKPKVTLTRASAKAAAEQLNAYQARSAMERAIRDRLSEIGRS